MAYGFAPLGFTPGYSPNVARVDPRLVEILSAAAASMPSGYQVTVSEGYNPAGHVANSQHHIAGRGALDVQIVGPDGKMIPNEGPDKSGMYTRLAQNAYGYMKQTYPELDGKLAWGGSFGVSGKRPNVQDLMHFDIGGERGGLAPRLAKLGPAPAGAAAMALAPGGPPQSPAEQAAAAMGAGGGRTLRQGMRGPDVAQLQHTLGISPDGVYGPQTAAAVKAFQRSNGLTADGVAGPRTFGALGGGTLQQLSNPAGGTPVQPVSSQDFAAPGMFPGGAPGGVPNISMLASGAPGVSPGIGAAGAIAMGKGDRLAAPFTPADNQMAVGRDLRGDQQGISELRQGMQMTSPQAMLAAEAQNPQIPAQFDMQSGPPQFAKGPIGGAPVAGGPPNGLGVLDATARASLTPEQRAKLTPDNIASDGLGPPAANKAVSDKIDKALAPFPSSPVEVQIGQPAAARGKAYIGAPGGPAGAVAQMPLPQPRPSMMAGIPGGPGLPAGAANAGSGPMTAPLSLDAIQTLQALNADHPQIPAGRFADERNFTQTAVPSGLDRAMAARANPPGAPDQGGGLDLANIGPNLRKAWDSLSNDVGGGASAFFGPGGPIFQASDALRNGLGIGGAPPAQAAPQQPPPQAPSFDMERFGPQSMAAPGGPGTSTLMAMLGKGANAMFGVQPANAAEPAAMGMDAFNGRFGDNPAPAAITPAGGPPGVPGVTFGGQPGGVPGAYQMGAGTANPGGRQQSIAGLGLRTLAGGAIGGLVRTLLAGPGQQGNSISYPGASYPGSPGYGSSAAGLSPFTPQGWHGPDFSQGSGGSLYSYGINPQLGPSFINSYGQTMPYGQSQWGAGDTTTV